MYFTKRVVNKAFYYDLAMKFMNDPFLEVEGPTVVVATSMILHSYASSIIINDETSI